MKKSELPKIRIYNPFGSGWLGTKYLIDGKKVRNVKSVDFHVAVDEIPVFEFETTEIPDIEMNGDVRFRFTPKTVTDAVAILRHELLTHIYPNRG